MSAVSTGASCYVTGWPPPCPWSSGWSDGCRRVTETLRHGTDGDAGSGRGTELLAIAVDPHQRGGGVGQALVVAFLDQVVADGGDAAHVVVGADNASAVQALPLGPASSKPAGSSSIRERSHCCMQWDRPANGVRP